MNTCYQCGVNLSFRPRHDPEHCECDGGGEVQARIDGKLVFVNVCSYCRDRLEKCEWCGAINEERIESHGSRYCAECVAEAEQSAYEAAQFSAPDAGMSHCMGGI